MVTVQLGFTLGAKELREADQIVAALEAVIHGTDFQPESGGVPKDPAVLVARRCAGELSQQILRVVPVGASNGLTPAEVATLLTDALGRPISRESARAAIRNIRSTQKRMQEGGEIDRRVICADWATYGSEEAGRYFVSQADREVLDAYFTTP